MATAVYYETERSAGMTRKSFLILITLVFMLSLTVGSFAGEAAREEKPAAPEKPAKEKKTAAEPVLRPRSRYPALVEAGSLDQGMAAADHRLEARYTCRYVAHVPLQPRSALAQWSAVAESVKPRR